MKKRPLSRDLVVRRGVFGFATLAHMLGLENADDIKEEELKEKLEEMRSSDKEIIATEKGFMSTSLPYAKSMFGAGDAYTLGIEFMILMKKGTTAADVETLSSNKDESEVLAAPGTKFRVIYVQYEGGGQIRGNEKSWRVYLESIPQSEEGVKKEAA